MAVQRQTNYSFADAIGIHYTMSSRLRKGDRAPSMQTFLKIVEAFALDDTQVMAWIDAMKNHGAEGSGEWLRHTFFPPSTPKSVSIAETAETAIG